MARLPLHLHRWRYSTRILFSGCDKEVYQQDLVIHRTAGRDHEEVSEDLKVWHIFIGPKCRPDYGDLRFTDRYGRELAYYLWPGYDSSSARIAVRLEGADAAGEVTAWYGNATATTASDGSVTFLFFDDFAEDLSQYNTGSKSNGKAEIVNAQLKIYQKPSGTWWGAYAATKLKFDKTAPIQIQFKYSKPTGYDPNLRTRQTIFAVTDSPTASRDTSHYYAPTSGQAELWRNSINSATMTEAILRLDGGGYKSLNGGAWTAIENWAAVGGTYDLEFYNCDYANYPCYFDNVEVRTYSATPPSILRTSRGVNPAYAGLARVLPGDSTIRFAGVGTIQVLGDERYAVSGAGAFAIETRVSSPITTAGTAEMVAGTCLMPTLMAFAGAGDVASEPVRMLTPLAAEAGVGTSYVAPTPVQFDVWQYRFESLDISRSAQDALWRCDGQIDGLQAPLAYKSFTVRVPDHNGVLRTIFFGFVPGRDYVQAVAANKSTVQGFDAGFYLTRQYLPDGDLYYPAKFLWTPMNLIKYWLGEEATWAGSPSRWEQVTGIMPYRIHNPSTYDHPYTPKDWNFQPKTTKAQAIQEVCEYSGMVFLVKWRSVNGAMTPCAYLVHQDDIDHATHGLDLPPMVTFTHPDPRIANGVRATLQSDEKYNRIEVRSASPSGAWFHAVRETAALRAGDELPIEYLEERSDLPIDADHGGWCNARADELYAYYTAYSYTYTLTLIGRTDLELYQRCRFYGFGVIPDRDAMRIVAIRYNVRPTHTEVEITVTPDSRLSDIRRLQRSQAADAVSEMQVIARSQIEGLATGEIGTVIEIDGGEAVVELERKAGSTMRGRIIT